MIDNWFFMKGFRFFMKEFAKMLMVLDQILGHYTYYYSRGLFIDCVKTESYSQQYFCHAGTPPRDRERLKGPNPIQICPKSNKSCSFIMVKVKVYFNITSVMPRHSPLIRFI